MTDSGSGVAHGAQLDSIDIDVGGTFTDVVLTLDGERTIAKAPTTPYDLSVCFMNGMEEVALEAGEDLDEVLPRLDVIRYSTTVAMNRLIERRGPRVGLIATEGHEDAILIGRGAQWTDGTRLAERRNLAAQRKPLPIVPREMIVGVKERVDSTGTVVRPLDEDDVRRKLRRLMERGARAIVVATLWSFANPIHEQRIKEVIREEYKEYHIGYLPVVLSSQVVSKLGEYERTMTAVLDAYLQRSMQTELSAMWDRLRDRGYRGSFLMIHNSGGSGEVFKTTASRTYNGGPVSGLMGSFHLARQLGYDNVVAGDMGGTSFDIGLVVGRSVRNYEFRPIIDRWMVSITMLQTLSIGAGGGSIAWINHQLGDQVNVGPRSAGSDPGPVCYDQGGSEPTVTDADVVLGYTNPEHYYGGRMVLDRAKAERAIRDRIADPLGVSVEEAAGLIRRIVDRNMASAIKREIHLRGYHPEDFALFAIGGAGPTHVSGFLGDLDRAVIFPSAPVFCAMGSSIMDIVHVYERSHRMKYMEAITTKLTVDRDEFNAVVDELIAQATADLETEGLPVDDAQFALELDMLYGGQVNVKRTASPVTHLRSDADIQAVYDAFEQEFSEAFSPLVVNKPGGVYLDNFVLKVTVPTPVPELETYALADDDPSAAQTGTRQVWWPDDEGAVTGTWTETSIFDAAALAPGNRITGPAVVEADLTTIVVPPGMTYAIDERGLGILERVEAREHVELTDTVAVGSSSAAVVNVTGGAA
jgi:N-methylhydantoinase A/oxoprolinase/acetone carboxylase beta subunit